MDFRGDGFPAGDAPRSEGAHEQAEPRDWTCAVTPRLPGRTTLTLVGALQAGWAARLASGLAARGVSVLRARAHKNLARVWLAELDVQAPDASAPVDGGTVDRILRDRGPLEGRSHAPAVTRYVLTPREDALEVQIRAPDSVGLLDRILRMFAFYGLFPCDLAIDTVRGEARDTFRLRTMTGEVPSSRTRDALERRLAALSGVLRV
ncbi:MAG: hypothetical protein QM704_19780 [Anaeromyxobacteraceae bacterium]